MHGKGGRGFHFQAHDARENGEFARDVEAVKVVSRVGLGEAEVFRFGDFGGEAAARAARVGGLEGVEEEGHGAGEDAFDFSDAVAGREEILQGAEDGEAGADGGFVVDMAGGGGASAGGRGGEDLLPEC